jgi:hypothetical protein
MTPEQQKREKFLRAHGSYPAREVRERKIQHAELRSRIDQLKQQIAEFSDSTDVRSVILRKAWEAELEIKRDLALRVVRGEVFSREVIRERTNEVALLRAHSRATSGAWREVR